MFSVLDKFHFPVWHVAVYIERKSVDGCPLIVYGSRRIDCYTSFRNAVSYATNGISLSGSGCVECCCCRIPAVEGECLVAFRAPIVSPVIMGGNQHSAFIAVLDVGYQQFMKRTVSIIIFTSCPVGCLHQYGIFGRIGHVPLLVVYLPFHTYLMRG